MSQTTLELVETTQESTRRPILHAYCTPCLEALYPQQILPLCGQGKPRNDDDMIYPSAREAPAEDLCVVCLHTERCGRCGV